MDDADDTQRITDSGSEQLRPPTGRVPEVEVSMPRVPSIPVMSAPTTQAPSPPLATVSAQTPIATVVPVSSNVFGRMMNSATFLVIAFSYITIVILHLAGRLDDRMLHAIEILASAFALKNGVEKIGGPTIAANVIPSREALKKLLDLGG